MESEKPLETMFNSERFYGVSEVAGILGVSRKTVWAMAKDGRLPPIHGACHRFRGDQLRKWADAGKSWKEIPPLTLAG